MNNGNGTVRMILTGWIIVCVLSFSVAGGCEPPATRMMPDGSPAPQWERAPEAPSFDGLGLYRIQVEGGWLYIAHNAYRTAMAFVPAVAEGSAP